MNASPPLRKPGTAYHHGDLRNALLRAARAQLDAGAYEGLSLRELARIAGVSANAPYRHFQSKDEILAELAAQGFDALSARIDAEVHPDPAERLIRLADIYTRFAIEQPALYRVMFGAEKQVLMEFEVLATAGPAAFGRLVAATAAASGLPGDAPLALQRAVSLWAVVHGWARLAIDGITCFLPEDAVLPASAIVRDAILAWGAEAAGGAG